MWQERISRYLLPGPVEQDKGFRDEILRLSHLGLRVVGGLQIIVACFMLLARFVVAPDPETASYRLTQGASSVLLGLLCIVMAAVPGLFRWSRLIAALSGVLLCCVIIWYSLLMTAFDPTADDFIPGQITLVMLVGVAAIPLKPAHTLLFGFLVESAYVGLSLLAHGIMIVGPGVDAIFVLFIFMLTLLATGLSAILYEQRRANYEAHLDAIRAAEHLRKAEARNLLSENAASVGRLAAAISHELNSPIGALVSGVDTLLLVASRQATSSPEEAQRLIPLQADLRRSIKQSTDRLRELVTRMQRFTNLDKAEVQSANVNDILSDVTTLLEPQWKSSADVQLDLQPLPDLVCRPQQLSAVFSSLLGNAVEALNGNGRIRISTRQSGSMVQVSFEDNGRGMKESELATIFDPGFKVARDRVSTGNWSMFSSRQIVQEHGGDISITSTLGEGTQVIVNLPYQGDTGLESPS
jgi:two-component system, NtrC family, sensor kinase